MSRYLSRNGLIYGPYTSKDVEVFQGTGEFSTYAWIWEAESPGWKPIHPMPQAPAVPIPQEATVPGVQIICYNHEHVVSGQVERLTSTGFVLASDQFADRLPPFGRGSRIFLDILDEASGEAESVDATIVALERSGSRWLYEMKWVGPVSRLFLPGSAKETQ